MEKVKGLIGFYRSPAELILEHPSEAVIDQVKTQVLTIKNTQAQNEIERLKKSLKYVHYPKRRAEIAQSIRELQEKLVIKLYAEENDNQISVPPGFFFLAETIKNNPYHLNKTPPVLEFPNEPFQARYYQKDAVESLMQYSRSHVVCVTGSGKSKIISMLTISYLAKGYRVIIITPSTYLLSQLYKSTKRDVDLFFPNKILSSRIGDGHRFIDGSLFAVSTIQSALGYVDRFDAVIVDELHVTGAEGYREVGLASLSCKFFHGMTGTIERLDGMDALIPAFAGKKVYEYTYKDGLADKFLNPVHYYQMPVETYQADKEGENILVNYSRHYSTTEMIAKTLAIVKKSTDSNRTVMILGRTLEVLEKLGELLGVKTADANYKKPVNDFCEGKTKVLIATTKLVGTGVDVPAVDTLIFLYNGASKIDLVQGVGRIIRIAEEKKPSLVFDLYPKTERSLSMAYQRRKTAIAQGWKVE